MIELLRYSLSSSSSTIFLPSIPNLSDVRRLALQESCRDVFLSSSSGSSEDRRERWGDVIKKAIVSSPTLSDEERREVERKISEGRWDELLLDSTISATDAVETGRSVDLDAIVGLEGLLKMLHDILTHSRAVWKLTPSDRRDFVADALFNDVYDEGKMEGESDREHALRNRQLFLSQFVSAVNEIQDEMEFSLEKKSEIVDDISSTEYFSLLLPSRFDCEENIHQDYINFDGNASSAMSAALVELNTSFRESNNCANKTDQQSPSRGLNKEDSVRRDSLDIDEVFNLTDLDNLSDDSGDDSADDIPEQRLPTSTVSQDFSKSADLAAFANVSRKTARDALDKTGGNTEDAAMALLDLVQSCMMDSGNLPPCATSDVARFTESMNLAEISGTSRQQARYAIDDVGGDLDQAADVLLSMMLNENNHDDPTQVHSSGFAPHRAQIACASIVEEEEEIERIDQTCDPPSSDSPQGITESRKIPAEEEKKEATAEVLRMESMTDSERLNAICDPLNSDSFRVLNGNFKVQSGEEECPICPICFTALNALSSNSRNKKKKPDEIATRTLKCGHSFCNSCLKTWVGEKGIPFPCPVCKTKISYMSYHLKPWLKKTKGKRVSY